MIINGAEKDNGIAPDTGFIGNKMKNTNPDICAIKPIITVFLVNSSLFFMAMEADIPETNKKNRASIENKECLISAGLPTEKNLPAIFIIFNLSSSEMALEYCRLRDNKRNETLEQK